MNIKNKFNDFKARLSDRHMYSIVLVVTAVIAGFGIYQYKRSIDFRNRVENGYQRAFTELVHYVNNLDTTLTKAAVATSPAQLSSLAVDLWRQAAFAQANLGQLPVAHTELDNTATFLSQVGDYTYALSKKVENGEELTQQELDQLASLQEHASTLNERLTTMQSEMFGGVLRFDEFKNITSRITGGEGQNFDGSMKQIEEGFSEYASLIYDGPFSEHIRNREPRMTKGKPDISAEQAAEAVKSFLGADHIENVEVTGESEGIIPTYNCTVVTSDDKRQIFVEVTKQGGYVMMVLDNKAPENAELDVGAAALKAREFLTAKGYNSMYESYYQREGNTVVINYAYKQGDYVMYTDLIKVKIALDDGSVIGFESHGYITNHIDDRAIPEALLTEEEARAKVNKNVEISAINRAMIPLDNGSEVFCYELKGNLGGKNFLVYVNVTTGAEEKILILLENEDGTLTI